MKADHLTYQRAAAVSVWGLFIQLALGLLLLIYSILGRDHAAQSASIFVLAGVVPWLTLAVVFDQHRRERLEAMEADTLDAQNAREASVFSGNAEVRVNASRLAWMHRWLVPAVSLALGAGLIVAAVVRFRSGLERLGFDKGGVDQFAKPADRGWAIAVGIALGVIGFVFARFVSGMAKQRVWANLRGGAAYAVGASLIGVAMLLGHLLDLAGTDVLLRYLQVAIPALMGLIGAEVFVSFLLNLYRPRKPGDVPRPAFDSPVLSFVASPDRIAKSVGEAISYQFGVDVTGSWAYRLMARYVVTLVVVGLGVLWVLTCFDIVQAGERGLRIRNGRLIEEVGPGLYVKAPWPIEVIETRPVGVNLGADGKPGMNLTNPPPGDTVGVVLWTQAHGPPEMYNVVQGSSAVAGGPPDLALITTVIPLVYTVESLRDYDQLANPDYREDYIRAVAQRQVWPYLASLREDELLGAKRHDASAELARRVTGALAGARAGVKVLFTGLEGMHPPRETAEKFEAVVNTGLLAEKVTEQARARETEILTNAAGSVEQARRIVEEVDRRDRMSAAKASDAELAQQDAKLDELITSAGGAAGQLLSQARTQRWTQHMGQRGRAEAYQGQLAAFNANPEYYKLNRYLDVLTDVLKNTRLYIVPDNIGNLWTNLDLQDKGTGGDVFQAGTTSTNP